MAKSYREREHCNDENVNLSFLIQRTAKKELGLLYRDGLTKRQERNIQTKAEEVRRAYEKGDMVISMFKDCLIYNHGAFDMYMYL